MPIEYAPHLPPIVLNTGLIGREPFANKVRLARRLGFAGLEMFAHEVVPRALSRADCEAGAARFGFDRAPPDIDADEVNMHLAENGMTIDGLIPGADLLQRWSIRLDDDLVASLEATMRATADLGVRYLVLPTIAEHSSLDQVADSLSEIAPLARRHGLLLGLEPIGQTPVVRTIKDALTVLDRADLDHEVGIVLDSFHFFRAGQHLADLAPLTPERIVTVQVNDAVPQAVEKLMGNRHRTFPGEGQFDVTGFCATLFEKGYCGAFAVEILNPELSSIPAEKFCRHAIATTRDVLTRAMGNATATKSGVV